MNYTEWERGVPADIKGDGLWKMEVYRLALFMSDLSWIDVTRLVQDRRTVKLSDQLYSAVGSIGANVAEGHGRSSGKDRVRFYEYALGSGREGRDWYDKGRHVLGDAVAAHRMHLLTQIVRLLLTMIPDQRHISLKDEPVPYAAALPNLLSNAPLPE
jgi:four helix bundle protein